MVSKLAQENTATYSPLARLVDVEAAVESIAGISMDLNNVKPLGTIARGIYVLAGFEVIKDDIVITKERIEHVNIRHPGDWDKFGGLIMDVVNDPDEIYLDDDYPGTGLAIKVIKNELAFGVLQATVRIFLAGDPEERTNSIISYQYIKMERYKRIKRNKKLLYSKEYFV
ncbi:hypothetical protein AGMMS49992_33710 [Clostridia bacterium]|nr:hypothetical protein AGMMS49992_33710 [Clostridia bacterium]